MVNDQDESVFYIQGVSAAPLAATSIAALNFTERQHLQEWIIANPSVLGPGVRVVTFEFDQWQSSSIAPKDRLDVLGLADDGHLVVAELKRGVAPDTTDVQAIKYAAMVSRFDLDTLAEKHHAYLMLRGEPNVTLDEARERLELHSSGQISDDSLRSPRIVLVAEKFSVTTTSSVVWLTEQGVDISLVTYRAYPVPGDSVVLTTSRTWPLPEAEGFVAKPRAGAGTKPTLEVMPTLPWTLNELEDFANRAGEFMLALLDRLATNGGHGLPSTGFSDLGFSANQASGAMGAIATQTRHRWKRQNTPVTAQKVSGVWRWSMEESIAVQWREVRGLSVLEGDDETAFDEGGKLTP